MCIEIFQFLKKGVDKNFVNKNIYIESSEIRNDARNKTIVNSFFDDCVLSASKSNQLASDFEPDP